jgi:hypothetical protein
MIKRIIVFSAILLSVYLVSYIYFRMVREFSVSSIQRKFIVVKQGDIIVRPNSNILFGSEKRFWGGLSGHVAIVVKDGAFYNDDENLGNVEVIEARLFNRNPFSFENRIVRNKATRHYGKQYMGRRYLLRVNMTKKQFDQAYQFYLKEKHTHYNILSKKEDSTYNCATFTRKLMLVTLNVDLDSNDGKIVFPNDIINHSLFDVSGARERF